VWHSVWHDAALLNRITAVLVMASLIAIGTVIVRKVAANQAFAIQRVVVNGELRQADAAHIAAVIQQGLRGTFFTVDLAAARDELGKVPWVRSVAVRRHWPATLEVAVTEQQPLARWNDTALVSIDGEVFDAEYGEELPDFYGPDGSAAEMTARYREFASSLRGHRFEIDSLTRSARGAWDVKLDDGTTIALGREHVSERWARWIELSDRFGSRITGGGQLVALDLRYENGFAARIVGGAPPASDSKNPKNTKSAAAVRSVKPAPAHAGRTPGATAAKPSAAVKKLAKAPAQTGPVQSNRG
jgi:cell division protein FtsQ